MTSLLTSDVSDHELQTTPAGVNADTVDDGSLQSHSSLNLSAAGLAAMSSALLAACGGGGGGGGGGGSADPGAVVSTPGFNNFPQAKTDEEAARFLQQSQFASLPADIDAVKATSFANYLQQQFAKPQTRGWDWLESRGYGVDATLNKYIYSEAIADFMVWRQLMGTTDAMRQRFALALSEFFVVSFSSMEIDWRGYTMAAFWDMLAQHSTGNFRDLLEAVTLSPAMGYFLNTKGNQKEDSKSGRLPDENYAREVMQLFSIGLYELNVDGTVKTDASNKKLETYDSDDVSQLARIFTGYDYDKTYAPESANGLQFPGGTYKVWAREYARRPMVLNATKHSTLPVSFLSANITSTSGPERLKQALDTLFNHPNVGPFFGRQMIQRLVTSNPSKAYVERVARAFNNNGAGVRGDMKAVWTAILLDDEARSPAGLSNNRFGKLREPILRFVQWARSFNARSLQDSWKIFDLSDPSFGIGQSPFHSPSVFNFFRPGYVPPGTVMAQENATAPEFQGVNETTVGGYINFMQEVIRDGFSTSSPGTPEVLYTPGVRTDIFGDYTSLLALIDNTDINDAEAQRVAKTMTVKLNLLLCAGQLSATTQAEISGALTAAMLQTGRRITKASSDVFKRDLVASAILMVMASADYLIQK